MTKKKIIVLSSILIITIVLAFSASYALFRFNVTKNTNFKLVLGTLELVIKDTTTEDRFVLTNVVPTKDEVALEQKGYTFTLSNTGTIDSYYSIYLDDILLDDAGNRLDDSYVRINLLDEKTGISTTNVYSELLDGNGLLKSGFLKSGESITYTFHMWLKYDAGNDAQNKYFATQIRVVGTQSNAKKLLSDSIFDKYSTIYENPTLTASSNNTSDVSGLYKSTATNSGNPTYYFRGNVENNYVSFAGQIWRIVRINEDGTIRIVTQDSINDDTNYIFNSNYDNYSYMYYSNSEVKAILDNWYDINIGNNVSLSSKVTNGDYFCEQAKSKISLGWSSGDADMQVFTDYIPDFKCSTDGNGKGIVNASVGLLTYDEVVHAGGYYAEVNSLYYLNNSSFSWLTMSPAGFNSSYSRVWRVSINGSINNVYVNGTYRFRVVLNLNKDTTVFEGIGTSTDPFVISS